MRQVDGARYLPPFLAQYTVGDAERDDGERREMKQLLADMEKQFRAVAKNAKQVEWRGILDDANNLVPREAWILLTSDNDKVCRARGERRVRLASSKGRTKERFTALLDHINTELLEEAFFELAQNATKVTRAEPPPSAEDEARLADCQKDVARLGSHLHRLRSDGPEAQDGKTEK